MALTNASAKSAYWMRDNCCSHAIPSAAWCHRQVTGCSQCIEERRAPAPGAQFPGMRGAPVPPVVVHCLACATPAYTFNTEWGICGVCLSLYAWFGYA